MTLVVLCEHGESLPHTESDEFYPAVTWSCPGGREATPEDVIEALGGEKVWWCEVHRSQQFDEEVCWLRTAIKESFLPPCRMVERILTRTIWTRFFDALADSSKAPE